MVEASSMKITATMDIGQVRTALGILSNSLKTTQKESKSTGSDFKRLEVGITALGRATLAAGAFFTGMIYEAARKAPALAGSMANIKTNWDSMIRSLGEGLAPAFEKVDGWMSGIADWASAHPDIFAGVVGGVATVTVVAGLIKLLGLGPVLVTAGAALLPFLGPIAAGTVLAGLLALTAYKVGNMLADATVPAATNVPVPEAAKAQILTAKNNPSTGEYYDLVNRYGLDPFSPTGGAQLTPEIDPNTGLLVSDQTQADRIVAYAVQQMMNNGWTYSTRRMAMNGTDSYSSTGPG